MSVTPLERLESVRNEAGLSQGAFSLRCGWPRGQYATIAGRLRKGETDNLQRETAEAIEAAFGVRKEWLMFGTGPRRTDATAEKRYPERDGALARFPDLDPEIREAILGMKLHALRPTEELWVRMIEAFTLAKTQGKRLGVPSIEDEDEVPPIARRGKEK